MNEVVQAILDRRSCKKYKDKMLKREDIEEIIHAGLFAASGMGKQGAIIVAITNKEVRDQLSKMNAEIMHANIDPFYGAPVVLVVLRDKNVATSIYDGSLVMGNMMLAASAKGIGSCWIHRAKEEFDSIEGKALLKKIGVEGEYERVGHCILGYPDGPLHGVVERKANRVYWVD